MASIQIKRDKYIVQYYLNGMKKSKSTGLPVNDKNLKIVKQLKKELEDKIIISKHNKVNSLLNKHTINLSEAIDKFNKVHLSLKSVSHQRNFTWSMRYLTSVVEEDRPVTDITTEDISEYISVLKPKVSNSTLHTYITYVKMLFNYLAEENYIIKTPFRKRQTPRKEDTNIEIFSLEDLNSLFNHSQGVDYKMYKFMNMLLLIGTRPIDLVNLKYGDLKFDQNQIIIRMAKTGNVINFPLYQELLDYIINQFPEALNESPEKLLFPDYTVSHVGKKYRKFLRYLKISKSKRYTLKTFRKTFGTNMAALNMPVKDLMYLMGHREVETTMKYYVKANSAEIGKRINLEQKLQLK